MSKSNSDDGAADEQRDEPGVAPAGLAVVAAGDDRCPPEGGERERRGAGPSGAGGKGRWVRGRCGEAPADRTADEDAAAGGRAADEDAAGGSEGSAEDEDAGSPVEDDVSEKERLNGDESAAGDSGDACSAFLA